MKRKKAQALTGLLLCLPLCLGLVFFYGIPLLLTLHRSLLNGMSGQWTGLDNYVDLLTNPAFGLGVRNTLLFWMAGLPLNLGLGLALALLCERAKAKMLRSVFFFPAMLPAACAACMAAGWLQGRAAPAGPGVVLILYLWKSVGVTAVILGAALHTIPQELLDTSAALGASGWQTLFYVKLPLILPALGAALIAALLNSFRIFREAYLLGGPHPQAQLYTLHHFLYNNFANMNYSRLAAASVLLIFVIAAGACTVAALLKRKDDASK